MPDALYFDLLDFSLYSSLLANPSRLENLIPPNFKDWIVIDEIQRIPELLNQVHRLIENRKFRFLLTVSDMYSIRRKGINLLAGRALIYNMHPLVVQEIGNDFSLAHALKYGMLPMAVTHDDPKKYLESYIQTYLQKEVVQEICLLPFSVRAKRKMIAHQKFYFFDTGVYRFLKPSGLIDTHEEAEGCALESLFFQSLRAINDYHALDYSLHFWRTQQGAEVDFVAYGPKGLHAFEIKRSSTVTPKALKGLKQFGEDYPEAQLHLVYMGKHREYHDAITVWPMQELLMQLPVLLK